MGKLVMPAQVVEINVDVRGMDFYKTMLAECSAVVARIRPLMWNLVREHWLLGLAIANNYNSVYGEKTMETLAEDLHKQGLPYSPQSLYLYRQFALQRPTEADLQALRDDMDARGLSPTWSNVRQYFLPANTDRPDLYGGAKSVAEEVMSQTERLTHNMEKLTEIIYNSELTNGQRREVAGVVLTTLEKLGQVRDAFSKVSPPAKVQYFIYAKGGGLVCCDVGDVEGILQEFSQQLTQVDSVDEMLKTEKSMVVVKGQVIQKEARDENIRDMPCETANT